MSGLIVVAMIGKFTERQSRARERAEPQHVMPLCRRCERVVVKDCELYCGRQCAGAALGDARWHSLPPTTHALQRGEHALLHFPAQDGGPRGDNYFPCVIRDFQVKHPLTASKTGEVREVVRAHALARHGCGGDRTAAAVAGGQPGALGA